MHKNRYDAKEKAKILRAIHIYNNKFKRGGVVYAKDKFGVNAITLSNWVKDEKRTLYLKSPRPDVDSLSRETAEILNKAFERLVTLNHEKEATDKMILREQNIISGILDELAYKSNLDVSAKNIGLNKETLLNLKESFDRLNTLNQKQAQTTNAIQKEKNIIRMIVDDLRQKSATHKQDELS
jgi:hypothetical protein